MAVSKPSWLRTWLSRLNWDIFTWKVYIGDSMEEAIDWTLEWVNWGIDQANQALNRAWDAWYKAGEVFSNLSALIYRESQSLWNRAFAWWSEIGEWWRARAEDVKYWIDVAQDFALDQLKTLSRTLDSVSVAWDSFFTETLPGLFSWDNWTTFWGGAWQTISDWWGARLQQVKDLIETNVKPVRDEVNKQASWWDMIKDLLRDPEEWLLKLALSLFKRFW